MEPRVLECPRCGAPLPRRAALVRVTCEYCKSEVIFERLPVQASDYRRMLEAYESRERADVTLAGFRLRLLGRLAVGHSSDVFLATRATRITERLLVKVLRAAEDEALLRNEQSVLGKLEASAERGTPYFTSLVPQRAFSGLLEGSGFSRPFAAAFRQPPGFAHTLAELRQRFPGGMDPRHGIWIWRRALELLDWLHRSGIIHGAILPEHILLDAREHSVGLVGFSCAGAAGTPLAALDPRQSDFYPAGNVPKQTLVPAADLAMLARCIVHALGGEPARVPSHVPAPLARLLAEHVTGNATVAPLELSRNVSEVARECFGPPKFVKLDLL
ncbi:MAG: hypothetical protein ABUL60_09670 [Myxococcales bacterium]